MDRNEEDMKLVGFFGIFARSFKAIFSNKKIFSQITLTLILPLTLIFLAHNEISHHFFRRIESGSWPVDPYESHNPRRATALDWLYYLLFKVAYFVTLAFLSLLSTAAVVFTVASLHTGRDVLYRKVMTVVPKVWKRLLVTFLYIYVAFFLYNILAGLAFFISRAIFGYSILGVVVFFAILASYVLGFLYLAAVWQLATVVAVLEDVSGFQAMKKAKGLVKGKKRVSMSISFVLYGILLGIVVVYALFVEYGGDLPDLKAVWRVVIGIACGFSEMCVFLLLFVSQSMVYLVCKSHHREAIDKASLSSYLGVYSGEAVVGPKVGEEIQLGRARPPAEQV